jgi:cytochrome c553
MSRSATLALAWLFAFAAGPAARAQDAASMRLLAANCANCHGTDGHSQGGVPSLAGQPRDKLAAAMREFKSGTRPATVMQQLAKGYTDTEIEALAAWFAAEKP